MKSVCMLVQNSYELDMRVRRKAEALIAAGYSVDVLSVHRAPFRKTYTLNGVNIHNVSLAKRRGSLARYAFEYLAFVSWTCFHLTSRMPSRRYALVDVNTLPDFLVFSGIFARWMGAKLLLDMHEITPEFYMSKYGIEEDSRWIRLLKYLEKISFDFADHVVTINEPIRDLFVSRGLPGPKTTVIMNSADEANFGLESKATAAERAGLPKFVMMYHGTLTKIYGLDIAIEAFSFVHEEMPGAEMWILGDGTEQIALEKLARDRGLSSKVRLLGFVPPRDIPSWLSKCDVGILPIRRDKFLEFASPNKLSEYIVKSRPVIIARLKAIRYYFSENALAYFEPNDPVDLSRQMLRIYRDKGLRARLAATAEAEYAPLRWEVMKQRYLALVEKMIGPAQEIPEASLVAQVTTCQR